MKTLYELCKPRQDVFDDRHQDDALDLANLTDGSIDADLFFEETYFTEGMKQLVNAAFMRFAGKGSDGLICLKQAMGGGKTHNMVTLGLLAQHPELRNKVAAAYTHGVDKEIKVVSYTGRNSDIPYGIWGEIARQLGKLDKFNPYYTPLAAPGQSAWIDLLQDEPVLILLDELPPYLEYLRTRQIGTGTLAEVTVTALSNLFNAVNKSELANVCIVISDLKSTYESGSMLLEKSFKNLEGEMARTAMYIEPVKASSDDLYNILKKKLFETLPAEQDVIEVATEYKNAVNKAKKMNYTGIDANSIFNGICQVYPFYPCIKDLFARFKENNNFQQTRGFIRLTRLMVRSLFAGTGDLAKKKHLINAFDYNLNDNLTSSMITNIKPKITGAISHDICGEGRSAAEEIDAIDHSTDMQEIAKMILMASLGDVQGVILGLNVNEIIGYMVTPERDMANFKKLIEQYSGKAWYLYTDKDNRLFFKDIKNVNAQLNNMVSSFNNEEAKQEIKKILRERFAPKAKDCYQKLLVFPAVDEIQLSKDNVTLILFEPNVNGGLPQALGQFFLECDYPNRVMFLSGQHDTMANLLERAKEQRAICTIIDELKNAGASEKDTQYVAAQNLADKIAMNVNSALNETFVTLYYPSIGKAGTSERSYRKKEIQMNFENNAFDPEEQVRKLLVEVKKFTEPAKTQEDTFRKKVEAKLFTADKMRWADILERAAVNTDWNWYYPTTLRDLKAKCLQNGLWIEEGDMLNKKPPVPKTSVAVREIARIDGTVTLKLTPSNGDVVRWEIGQPATVASAQVKDVGAFQTDEMVLYFVCEDTTGKHETGDCTKWTNKVNVQYNFYDADGLKYCELRADNPKVKIKYTTDGSNPKEGGIYLEPFAISKDAVLLQAVAYYEPIDLYGEVLSAAIPALGKEPEKEEKKIDNDKPLILQQRKSYGNNKAVYDLLTSMKKFGITLEVESLTISDVNDPSRYIEIASGGNTWTDSILEKTLENVRNVILNGIESDTVMQVEQLYFTTGEKFKDWVADNKEEISKYINKVKQ